MAATRSDEFKGNAVRIALNLALKAMNMAIALCRLPPRCTDSGANQPSLFSLG